MNNKVLYVVIAVLIILGIGLYVYNNHQQTTTEVQDSSDTTSPVNTEDTTASSAPITSTAPTPTTPAPTPPTTDTGHFSDESDAGGEQVAVHQVTYNGTSFSPSTLTIKQGDIVVFKNSSSDPFWPASAPHPTHTDYPEFDAKKAIASGGQFQFKFTKVGTWAYHNHLNPSATGKIIVTE